MLTREWCLAEDVAANCNLLHYVRHAKKMFNGNVHLARKRQTSQFIHMMAG